MIKNKPIEIQFDYRKYFVIGSILSLFFAYIIAKDVTLPQWLILSLGIVGLGTLFFKGFRSPELVLMILVCYIPFSKLLMGDFGGIMRGLNLTNILTIFILVGWSFKSKANDIEFWDKSPLNVLIYIFIFIGFISLLHAWMWMREGYSFFFLEFKRWITPLIFYFLAYNIARDKSIAKALTYTIMFIVFIVALMAIRDYLNVGTVSISKFDQLRSGGIANQPNQLAAFFVYYIFFYAGFILVNMSPRYWLLLLPMIVTCKGLMVTFSRGGYISFAAGCLGLAFFKNKILFLLTLLVIVIMWTNPGLLPSEVRHRMEMTYTNENVEGFIYENGSQENLDPSVKGRIEAWKGAIEMIKDKPLLGVGYGLFPYFLPKYNPAAGNMDAHNTYLIMGAEQGIFSVIVLLLIIFTLMKNANWILKNTDDKFYRSLALGFLGGLIGLLAVNFFGSRLNSLEISGYFWILAGMIMRIRKDLSASGAVKKYSKNIG